MVESLGKENPEKKVHFRLWIIQSHGKRTQFKLCCNFDKLSTLFAKYSKSFKDNKNGIQYSP